VSVSNASIDNKMVQIPGGSYQPFFVTKKKNKEQEKKSVVVKTFWMDKFPVTQKEYLKFLRKNSEWRKSQVKKIFSDLHYLENWSDDTHPPKKEMSSPIVYVSWFAASAYCKFVGKRLPTIDEWEYVADDHEKGPTEAKDKILEWYSKPNPPHLSSVGKSSPNGYGIYDLYGLIWEWTLDFNSQMMGDEGRATDAGDNNLFCGNGAAGAVDSADYARFMRYSFRNSLKANYSVGNLGFRCAKD
jgi:formylglycine-generating enzyme required for sulfatase activity